MVKDTRLKVIILGGIAAVTVAIHYGWVLEYLFGHQDWVHAVHSRFCYIPIAVAAAWFGLRGGLYMASIISALVIPFLLGVGGHQISLPGELVEIFFYFAIGILVGALVDREASVRRQREATQRQLERGHKLTLVGQMAAGVAHEIKNPLASIKGAVEILSDESIPRPDRAEFKDIILREIKRIDGTVREFLELARLKESHFTSFDFSAEVESVIKQLSPQLDKGSVRVSTDIQGELSISGDQDKVRQVVLNLVINALEASPSGGTIDISLRRVGDGVSLRISDHGAGIATGDLERVFEPFFTTKSAGTGLGLAVVKTIIENHGGTITVTSIVGQGAAFEVNLPSKVMPS